jgi:hypothetical protein
MHKRVETECKTADQNRHQEQGSAAAQTRCHSGSGNTEILHAPSPAGTPTGVPQQGVAAGGGGGGAGGGGCGGGGGNGGTASARLPTSRGGARRHVGVVAAARRRQAGRLGWALSSLEHLSQLESLAHARLNGMGMGGAGLGASNLAALSATLSARGLSPQLSAQLSAQLLAGFGGAGFRGGLLGCGLSGGNGRRRPRVARQWLLSVGGGGGGNGDGGGGGGGGEGGGEGGGFFGQRCGTLQGLRMSNIPMKDISTGRMSSVSQSNLELEMQQLADLLVWRTFCSATEGVGTSDWFNSTIPMPAPSRRRHARCPVRTQRGAGCSARAP